MSQLWTEFHHESRGVNWPAYTSRTRKVTFLKVWRHGLQSFKKLKENVVTQNFKILIFDIFGLLFGSGSSLVFLELVGPGELLGVLDLGFWF